MRSQLIGPWLFQVVRLGIYLVILILSLFLQLTQGQFISWEISWQFYSVSGMGLFINAIFWGLSERLQNRRAIWIGSYLIDLILITLLYSWSQLGDALFLFVYLILILSSGLLLGGRWVYLFAACCSLSFSVVRLFGPDVLTINSIFILLLNNGAFFVVAAIAGYLSETFSAQETNIQQLRKLNELIVSTIPTAVLTVRPDGEIMTANPMAIILAQKKGVTGQNLNLIWPKISEKLIEIKDKSNSSSFEMNETIDDEASIFLVKLILVQADGSPWWLVAIEDLTEQKNLEARVRQNEKLAAIGQLSAGIAHEIRNPLAGISGSVELLSQNSSTEDDKKLFKIILREIDRLNKLISEFLDYAKPEKFATEKLVVSDVINECLNNLKTSHLLLEKLKLSTDLQKQTAIIGNRDKLKQAFLNLLINANQAVSKCEEPALIVTCLGQENFVEVSITDNGEGMSEQTKKRLFEPFFTTKAKGTGLGLAITRKIFEHHGAKIQAQSEAGKGTTFIIQFPLEN